MSDWYKDCREVIDRRFTEGGEMSDGEHRDVCASIAPRLARLVLKLVKYGTKANMVAQLEGCGTDEEWLARLWEESK